jgi:DNA transformation protein and related proteins
MTKNSNQTKELTDMPNVGSVLADTLRRAGIETPADLQALGSVEALLRIRRTMVGDKPCASKLYALEGAIRGIRWHDIPQDERAELWKRYQAL